MKRTLPRASLVFLFVVSACLNQKTQAQTAPLLGARMHGGFILTGTVNTPYAIQGTMTPADPNGWTPLIHVFLTNSPWLFIDYASPGMAWRYYRAVEPDTNAHANPPQDMALIPAGPFTMGDCFGDLDDSGGTPLHTVYVSGFYLDQYELTKARWDEVYSWAVANGYSFDNPGSGKGTNHPVYEVNWHDAVKWCNARSEKEGRVPAYYLSAAQTDVYRRGQVPVENGWVKWDAGYRLPTEAEWEKAARGGLERRRFPWGDTITQSQANYTSDMVPGEGGYPLYDVSPTRNWHPRYGFGPYPWTSPVGSFAANGYGLYDVAGNVWEWCWDWHGTYFSGAQNDPRGPASGSVRVIRGGCWQLSAYYCRVMYRGHLYYGNTGFRSSLPSGPYQWAHTGPILEARRYAGITLTGTPNRPYGIQASTNLSHPNGWMTFTNVCSTNRSWWFIDTDAPGLTRRYYRANLIANFTAPMGIVFIPAGTFTLGSPSTEPDRNADEGPQTRVTISKSFWMGKYEVTQREYLAVMGRNPSYFAGNMDGPVEQLSWEEATNYCGKLTEQERIAGRLPAGFVYRLPTEAEWEYACRAGTTTRFSYGDDLDYQRVGDYAWYLGNTYRRPQPYETDMPVPPTRPVGLKQPNAWGLYDLYGNAGEWCLDWYGTYPGGSVTDPPGPDTGSGRVIRGGNSSCGGQDCRSASRSHSLGVTWGANWRGFRVVLVQVP